LLTRNDLQDLARLRLREAEHLYKKGLYDGCVYLCGYVIEFALKARICKVLKLHRYPDEGKGSEVFRKHDFAFLLRLTGLEWVMTGSSPVHRKLRENWSIAAEWNPEARYRPVGTCDKKKARDVLSSINEEPDGVLTWLSKQW